jgi:TfoX/Sxy family transcriptional regulator of competence genes
MAYSEDYLNFVIDQLSEVGDFEHKKMFGGVGFFLKKGKKCRYYEREFLPKSRK